MRNVGFLSIWNTTFRTLHKSLCLCISSFSLIVLVSFSLCMDFSLKSSSRFALQVEGAENCTSMKKRKWILVISSTRPSLEFLLMFRSKVINNNHIKSDYLWHFPTAWYDSARLGLLAFQLRLVSHQNGWDYRLVTSPQLLWHHCKRETQTRKKRHRSHSFFFYLKIIILILIMQIILRRLLLTI